MSAAFPEIPDELLARLDVPGPRYTSYPTAPEWREDFGPAQYAHHLELASARPDEPLSLYVHLPFCAEMCTYCGCNVVIARDRARANPYLDAVAREMDLACAHLGTRRRVSQLHWGGGTPTFLDQQQIARLWGEIVHRFHFTAGAEVAIEIDPVVTSDGQLELLAELGFNRLSMGVQDFDPDVQRAIRRIQTVEETRSRLARARELGFRGINFDLILGLPLQTRESWTRTLERVAELRPDRLAVYSFAFVPEARAHQKALAKFGIPSGRQKLELRRITHEVLAAAGYRGIGMDHFALPEDELSRAQERRELRRNFQGYTVLPASDVVAFGATGISDVAGAYAQNVRPLPRYYDLVNAGSLATERGLALDADDRARRRVIESLMCNFWADLGPGTFAAERERLRPLIKDGLCELAGDEVTVTPLGRVFVRNIAMLFDRYLESTPSERKVFSRTV